MKNEEELAAFIEKWGGRTQFYELVEGVFSSPEGTFAGELSELINSNQSAKNLVREIAAGIANQTPIEGVLQRPFQGTPETHGKSVDDNFFCAKSPQYLQAAETMHDSEGSARNNEEGWPDDDRDIGEA